MKQVKDANEFLNLEAYLRGFILCTISGDHDKVDVAVFIIHAIAETAAEK